MHRYTSCHGVQLATLDRMRMHRFNDKGFYMLRRMAARCGERGWSARVLYVHQPWNPHFRLRLGADRRVRPRAPRSCLYLESGGRRLARLSAPGQPCCSDAGWVSDSPRWCRKAPQIAQHPGKIPPEFPRAIISRLENGPGSHGFNGFQAPFQEPETGCGVNFSVRKIPPAMKKPCLFYQVRALICGRGGRI